MNFTISEDECNVLDSVRGQLNLVSGLLTAKDSGSSHYNASDLCAFLSAQTDSMKSVLQRVDERYKVERNEDAQMSLLDWLLVIQHTSGTIQLHTDKIKRITEKMRKLAEVNPDMACILDAWIGALVSSGTKAEVMPSTASKKQKKNPKVPLYLVAPEAVC